MNFKEFNQKIQQQFDKMCKTGKLFRSEISGSKVWETYLSSFNPGDNKVFRDPESSEHNCNCCHNFIRRYGNIVAITENGTLESIFSNLGNVGEYINSSESCAKLLETAKIQNVFFETFDELKSLSYESCKKSQDIFKLGIEKNFKKYTKEEVDKFGVVNTTDVYEFHHFNLKLPTQFVDKSGKSIEQIMAFYRDKYSVFKRAMEEIPFDTLELVKDLIKQGSLLDGTAHLHVIEEMLEFTLIYNVTSWDKDIWNWLVSYSIEERVAKFRNTLIGVLCIELAEGMELNKACENWNKRVDPVNYHKATAPITQKQINEAKKFIEENGYEESFDRRFATIDDIKVSEILHSNVGDGKIKSVSIFDNVKSTTSRHKKSEFDKLEEIHIEKFMKDILPGCTSIEAYLENRMEGNLVTLTTANNPDSKKIFKWDNNYSWAFNGNLAGKSQIKEAVKSRGGKTEGDIRISIYFPNTTDDYDLHLTEPGGYDISYHNVRELSRNGGMLDLDAQGIDGKFPPDKRVENIIYSTKSSMRNGEYKIYVHNYYGRGCKTIFNIEVEIEGEITSMQLKQGLSANANIGIIQKTSENIIFIPSNDMEILESKTISKEIWNLETNHFHKVNLVCLSPNHWNNNKVGNLHYMFMLDNCKSNTNIRSFHNENLIPELLKHKKVMEVLGATNMLEPNTKQLSGLGFNSTVKDELVVKLQGTHKRMLKIKFN